MSHRRPKPTPTRPRSRCWMLQQAARHEQELRPIADRLIAQAIAERDDHLAQAAELNRRIDDMIRTAANSQPKGARE
jgi:hypothetical protein